MGLGASAFQKTWILGHPYEPNNEADVRKHAEAFFRFTYRRNMLSLLPSNITSDSGWGCMLRSAQMLMGYALCRHLLGVDWRLPIKSRERALRRCEEYCNIVRWFTDYPGFPHIYSLHHLVQCGLKYDKQPGQWYGPSTAALVLRDLARIHCACFGGTLEILVTQGDTIYVSEAEKIGTRDEASRHKYIIQQHHLQKQQQQQQQNATTTTNCVTDTSMTRNDNILLYDAMSVIHTREQEASAVAAAVAVTASYQELSNDKDSSQEVTTIETNHLACRSSSFIDVLDIATSAPLTKNKDTHQQHQQELGPLSTGSHCNTENNSTLPPPTTTNNESSSSSTSRYSGNISYSLNTNKSNKKRRNSKSRNSKDNLHTTTTVNSNSNNNSSTSTTTATICTDANTTTPVAAATTTFFDPLLHLPPPPPPVLNNWNTSLVVLIPLRLGISAVNSEYIEEIKEVLQNPHCIGLLGGRVNHAIYFVGHRSTSNSSGGSKPSAAADQLLGLDPHTVFNNPVKPPPVPPPLTTTGTPSNMKPSSCASNTDNHKNNNTNKAARLVSSNNNNNNNININNNPTLLTNTRNSINNNSNNSRDGKGYSNTTTTTPATTASYNNTSATTTTSHTPSSAMPTSSSHSFSFNSPQFSTTSSCFGPLPAPTAASQFPSVEYLSQVHVPEFVALDFNRLDPSLAIGFYFRDKIEFHAFCLETKASVAAKRKAGRTPLYTVEEEPPEYMYSAADDSEEDEEEEVRDESGNNINDETGKVDNQNSDENYVSGSSTVLDESTNTVDDVWLDRTSTDTYDVKSSSSNNNKGINNTTVIVNINNSNDDDDDYVLI